MKQIIKKVSALLCAAVLMASGAAVVSASADDAVEAQLSMIAESLTQTIVPLSEEEINSYMQGGDAFTTGAMTSWSGAKDELGEFVEIKETSVELSKDSYTVTVEADFKDADANFVYTFDQAGTPTSMSVDVQYPMSVVLERAGLNTLMGLGTVFCVLVFLSFVIYLFRFIPGLVEGKKKEAAPAPAPKAAPAPAAVPAAPAPAGDDALVAVIAAAIAASEGTSTDAFVVRSIRKINRKKW